jgi:methionyl-tRNA formyltransferase
MIFIGGGSLLRFALVTAINRSIKVDLVCAENDAGLAKYCQHRKIPVIETNNVNDDLLSQVHRSTDGVAILVNSISIIKDELLKSNIAFFNVHNGLVQQYRGFADVCVLASICHSTSEYGSTLQRLIPKQSVDAGPVLDQRSFSVSIYDDFATVFSNSIENYKQHLQLVLPQLASLVCENGTYLHGSLIYSYRHVEALIYNSPPERQLLACSLGKYSGLLPQLSMCLKNIPTGNR